MFRRLFPLWGLALILTACGPTSTVPPRAPAPSTTEVDAWVEETLSGLTLRQKVGQMVVPWIGGEYLSVESDAYDRLRDWVAVQEVGGIIVSIGLPLEVASKLNLLQEMARIPLLVAADIERGPGQRLNGAVALPYGLKMGGGTQFPPIMAFGAANDERLAYELGRITAIEGRAVGIHMAYAPVADVNNNPANPVINTRSYGEDPARVARMVAAQIRGLQENGMLATAKHFPGHGDTGVDSHIDLPVIKVDRARVDTLELVPFRAAIEAGVAAVMSAHIAFPALTGDTVPVTLSPKVLTGLLQEELGFKGLVITDALDMGGIVKKYGNAEAAVLAVEAGTDVLLMPPNVRVAIDAVVAAVEGGRIPESRIDRSVRKLLRAKAELGLHRNRTVDLAQVPHKVGIRSHALVAEEVAERSITLVRDWDRLVPARPGMVKEAVSIVYADDYDPMTGRTLQRELAARYRGLKTFSIDSRTPTATLDSILQVAATADVVFFSPFVRVLAYKGGVAIPEQIAAFVSTLAEQRPVIVTSFGSPYLLSQFPGISTYVLAWASEDVAQVAAARALSGERPITGVLPISVPPDHLVGSGERMDYRLATVRPEEVGMDPAKLRQVERLLEDAVAAGAVPGAAIAIGRHGKLVHLEGYGRLDPRPGFGQVTDSSIYDLASLTKVVATTTAAMLLVEEGKLDLDAPVSQYVPEWRGRGKDRVKIRNLLTHDSGLPAFGPLWKEERGKDAFLRRIVALDLEYAPGTKTVYSDYGMILLGLIIEKLAGQPLEILLHERVFEPLGMRETGFNPLSWRAGPTGELALKTAGPAETKAGEVVDAEGDPAILARIAPTEIDTIFRKTHLHGVVHDENAYAIGGVSGHAGLFSSARDLAVFAQMLLNGGHYDDVRLLRPETIRSFTARLSTMSSRALGWDTPSGRSAAGDYFSERSFGHTGFTGTSLWIDPERDVFVVLLTNRVNPTRANQKHTPLRRAIHDAVQQAIVDLPVYKRKDAES